MSPEAAAQSSGFWLLLLGTVAVRMAIGSHPIRTATMFLGRNFSDDLDLALDLYPFTKVPTGYGERGRKNLISAV